MKKIIKLPVLLISIPLLSACNAEVDLDNGNHSSYVTPIAKTEEQIFNESLELLECSRFEVIFSYRYIYNNQSNTTPGLTPIVKPGLTQKTVNEQSGRILVQNTNKLVATNDGAKVYQEIIDDNLYQSSMNKLTGEWPSLTKKSDYSDTSFKFYSLFDDAINSSSDLLNKIKQVDATTVKIQTDDEDRKCFNFEKWKLTDAKCKVSTSFNVKLFLSNSNKLAGVELTGLPTTLTVLGKKYFYSSTYSWDIASLTTVLDRPSEIPLD